MMNTNAKIAFVVFLVVIGSMAYLGCGSHKNVLASNEFDNITDEEAFNAVYSRIKHPSSIIMEDFKGGSPYYISEWSLDSPYGRSGSRAPLCTEDHNQAKQWAIAQNDSSSVLRVLGEERDAEKYHEFRMVNPMRPNDIVLLRVDKCSYLNRSSANGCWPLFLHDSITIDTIGIFELEPISTQKFSELVYYLWWTSNWNTTGSCIIRSSVYKERNKIILKMFETRLMASDYGLYDEIYLYLTTCSVDINTGLVVLYSKKVKTIQGRYNEDPYR